MVRDKYKLLRKGEGGLLSWRAVGSVKSYMPYQCRSLVVTLDEEKLLNTVPKSVLYDEYALPEYLTEVVSEMSYRLSVLVGPLSESLLVFDVVRFCREWGPRKLAQGELALVTTQARRALFEHRETKANT